MKARKLTPYIPSDADKAEGYALQFQKLIACATVSVKGSQDIFQQSQINLFVVAAHGYSLLNNTLYHAALMRRIEPL